jgi:hypothetical protein
MRRYLTVLALAVVMVMASAGASLAGEVKGPPGQIDNENVTQAGAHANSACAFSGLNDHDPDDEVGLLNDTQVQTAADSWKFYSLPKGSPGTLFGEPGLCRGGSNTGH